MQGNGLRRAICCDALVRIWPITSISQFGPGPLLVEPDMTGRAGQAAIDPAHSALYEAVEVKRLFDPFSTSFIPVSLFDLESRFFAPTRT